MAAGLVTSIIAFAVGAVLDFGVTVGPDQHGFNIHNVGVILMIVGSGGSSTLAHRPVRRVRPSPSSDDNR